MFGSFTALFTAIRTRHRARLPRWPTRYRKHLTESLDMNRTCILAFKNKSRKPIPSEPVSTKPQRYITLKPEKTLDALDLVENFFLNLLDWSSSNVLAIALANTLYLWGASDSSVFELITVGDENGPITSVSWAPDGRSRVGCLLWNNKFLTTRGTDGRIVNHNGRIKFDIVQTYKGHQQESNFPASRGGGDDGTIKFWNTNTGVILNSVDSGFQLAELTGHSFRVLYMAQSLDGCTVASADGEQLKFWNVFGVSKVAKLVSPFSQYGIRIQ
ncbi:hypothetical protein PTKIN_Ptkin15bG0107000 [Pterospermum kingtungense]